MQACTSKMNLSEEVDLEDYVGRPDKVSNAEISAICQVRATWDRTTEGDVGERVAWVAG